MFSIILTVALILAGAYWLWNLYGMISIRRKVPQLRNVQIMEPPPGESWPTLSIIVAACNEETTIASAAATLLKLDYPSLEIVLINDRSTDGTGAIIDSLAAADARIKAIHVTHLPDGWLGKVNAINHGLHASSGQWVLFTDADVHFSPDALKRAITLCQTRHLDHLAVFPKVWKTSPLLDCVISTFGRQCCLAVRIWAVSDPRSTAFMGVGAFNLVRREAFDRTSGFEWLKMEVGDDAGLGLMMKRSGAASCIGGGRDVIGLHWYETLGGFFRGAEKSYACVARCSALRGIIGVLAMLTLELLPLGLLAVTSRPWVQIAAGALVVVMIACNLLGAWFGRRSLLSWMLSPLGAILLAMAGIRSSIVGYRRGGVVWRGTLYPSRQLKEGCRVLPF